MSSNETIEKELVQMLENSLDSRADSARSPLSGSTDLIGDLGLESIQIMEFVVEVEDHYDISIALESLSKTKTIGDLAVVVGRELGDPE